MKKFLWICAAFFTLLFSVEIILTKIYSNHRVDLNLVPQISQILNNHQVPLADDPFISRIYLSILPIFLAHTMRV